MPDEEETTYTCDHCGREIDEAEVYIGDDGVMCPDCYLTVIVDGASEEEE